MSNPEPILSVEVKPFKGRKVMGLERFIRPEEVKPEIEIPKLWKQFGTRREEILGVVCDTTTYGLFTYAPPYGPGQDFHYLAGVEVDDEAASHIPDGMKAREIPENFYAMVTYQGPLSGIGQAFGYFYGTWLPGSNYECLHSYEFEWYDERFLGMENEKSIIELHFPVVEKRQND